MTDVLTLSQKTLNSLGYKVLNKALKKIFNLELSTGLLVQRQDDDFYCFMAIQNRRVGFSIGDTRTEGMMHRGAGGAFDIVMYDKTRIGVIHAPNDDIYDYLFEYVSPEEADYLKYEGSVGGNPQAVEKSLLILKKYLDRNSGNIYGFK